MTPKYYECHITTEPVFDERLTQLKEIVRPWKFKAAELLMQKRAADVPERSKNDTFCTGHSKTYDDMKRRMVQCAAALTAANYKVWRMKIEAVLDDVRTNVTL